MDGFQAKTISKKNIDIDKNIDFGITLKILGDLPIGIENIRMFDHPDRFIQHPVFSELSL